jgi:hypothetical protein
MPLQQWQDQVLQEKIAWENGGKKTTAGGPVHWTTTPGGQNATSQYCYWPDGTSAEVPTNFNNGCPISCQEIYDKQHAAPTPTPTPTPAPKPPSSEGMVPITIDIQAFTPGGTGPIPAQPLMQPQPVLPPPAPAPKPAAPAPAPVKPVEKKLDTGSAVGIGAILIAIGAAAFFGGK